jgi:pimeloyl-ACP methyl ester carboxylesterase
VPEGAQPHIVILIHGIRDYALWQNEIAHTLADEGFIPQPTNYGRFDLFRFLVPISYFRKRATDTVLDQIRDVRKQFPDARYSVIAHSFGTYVFAQILKRGFDLQFHRVIFCGSVLYYKFEFEQISDRFTAPIVNDVGTRDVWPALAESITWGYGWSGTYGFRRPRVTDRWHNGAYHGYFLSANFCRDYWVDFLREGKIVRAAKDAEPTRLWLRLLSFFKIKYFLVAGLLLAALATWVNASCRFDGTYSLGSDSDRYFYWTGSISALAQDVAQRCTAAKILGDQSPILRFLACRRYAVLEEYKPDDLKSIVSCRNFKFGGTSSERDPVLAIEKLGEQFPLCVSVEKTPRGNMKFVAKPERMSKVGNRLLCDCSPEQVAEFSRSQR